MGNVNIGGLHCFAKASCVLPQYIINDNDKVIEIIVCDSISGGADYVNDMPKQLYLVRRLEDGTTYRARYTQQDGIKY